MEVHVTLLQVRLIAVYVLLALAETAVKQVKTQIHQNNENIKKILINMYYL